MTDLQSKMQALRNNDSKTGYDADMAAMDTAPANSVPANTNTGILATATMSETLAALGETLGQWKPYDSQLPMAEIKGTRITKALYKLNTKTNTIAGTNSYARIPTKHLTLSSVIDNADKLAPYVLDYLQGIETLMLKEQHKNGQLNVFTDGLSINRLINKLDEGSENSRLSKVDIETWFDASISSALEVLFADKMGIDEDSGESVFLILEKKISAYKAKFASLAAPKPFIKEADCIAMISVMEKCEPDENTRSLLGSRFITKLGTMHNEKEEQLEAL
jgi:hypothetical protein